MVDSIQGVGSGYGVASFPSSQPLTDDQKSQVQSILSNYDPTKLIADDAKSIFKTLRQDGIKPGKDLFDAMKTAGFDPQKLRSLARPDGQPGRTSPAASASSSTASSSNGINTELLQMLQTMMNQNAIASLTSDQDSNQSQDASSLLSGISSASGTTSSSNGIENNLMQMMQSILSQYQANNPSSNQNNELISQLNKSGLASSGSAVNVSA
jgi:hypothetical protein